MSHFDALRREFLEACSDVNEPRQIDYYLRDFAGNQVGGLRVGTRLRVIDGEVYVRLPSRKGRPWVRAKRCPESLSHIADFLSSRLLQAS